MFVKMQGEAERNFKTMVNDPASPFYKYPEDYDLFHLASYDDEAGKFLPLDTPRHIIKAIEIKDQN